MREEEEKKIGLGFTIAARLVRVKGRTVYSVITSLAVRNTATLTHQLPNLTLHDSCTQRGKDTGRERVNVDTFHSPFYHVNLPF